jgi:hypothetical protein
MGLYRDNLGVVVEMDDAQAAMQGYAPVSAGEQHAQAVDAANAARGEERGWEGTLNSGLTGLASGLTVGGSDILLGKLLPDANRERLEAEVKANPGVRSAGEIGGALLGAFAAPGGALAATPAGYLGSLASRSVEAGIAQGGARGMGQALVAMGTEGALQNAGQYIGHAALEDVDTSAEGFSAALGTGFAFGAGAGGAALGVVRGTVAARKMYSKLIDGNEDALVDVTNTWKNQSQALLEADADNAAKAKQILDDISAAKRAAGANVRRTDIRLREEQARAADLATQPKKAPFVPEPTPPMGERFGPDELYGPAEAPREQFGPFEYQGPVERGPLAGDATQVLSREQLAKGGWQAASAADVRAPRSAAEIPEEGLVATVNPSDLAGREWTTTPGVGADKVKMDKARRAIAEGQKNEITIAVSPNGKLDIVDGRHRYQAALESGKPIKVKWERGSAGMDTPRASGDDLVAQLEGTKKALDTGANLSDIDGAPRPFGDADIPEEALSYGRFATFGEELPWERAYRETADSLGDDIAKQEADLFEALEEFEAARKGFLDRIVDDAVKMNTPQFLNRGSDYAEMATPSGFSLRAGDRELSVPLDFAPRSPAARAADAVDAAPVDATVVGKKGKKLSAADHLEAEHNAAIARGDEEAAAELEAALARLSPDDVVDNVAMAADVITRYEKASAMLTEVLGENAHPISAAAAEQLTKAEADAMRKYTDRSARAMEDAETFGPWLEYGPANMPTKERLKYAKADKASAKAEYAKIAAQEAEAKAAYDKAAAAEKSSLKSLKAETKAAKAAEKAAGPTSKVGRALDVGAAIEVIDIPGIPKPSDLPVVGSLLGAYLKFRAVKAAMSRVSGRVPATAEAKMAVLSAKTKDRIASAIDRSLNVASAAGQAGKRAAPQLAGVLSSRIYDDGEPDAPKNASLPELAAVRSREIAAYVNTPGAIEADVRSKLVGVTNPDLIAAVEKHRRMAFEYLLANAPKVPQQSPLVKTTYLPSPAVSTEFARRYEAVNDPASIYERIEGQQAMITLEAADALRKVYPSLFVLAQQRLMAQAAKIQHTVPTRQRIQMSMLYGIPLDPSMDPVNMEILQQSFVRKPAPMPAAQGAPPTPAVAAPVNLTALYQTTADRGAQR